MTVIVAFVSLRVNILGMTFNQTIVLILGLLAINALVERFLSLKKIEADVLSFSNTHMPRIENALASVELTPVALQLGIAGISFGAKETSRHTIAGPCPPQYFWLCAPISNVSTWL